MRVPVFKPLVTVDPSRRVLFATLADDGGVLEPPSPVDPGPLGVTAGSPAVALGSEGVAAALAEQGLDAPVDVYLGEETLDEMCLGVFGIAYSIVP
ncbi:hypothetical protein [Enhygromyxa salina]|uniref:hypothetical protein n=1 Tax=Enhygromyxa salina TaxID=215803 RepID=UPI0011B1C7D6|nr:hypothetical protein [Enhygromyxa salina]